MSEELRATTAELKKRQMGGGDWYKTDATATEKPVVNSHKYDAGPIHAAPLPGSRDSDLDVSTLTSGRHAMKNEYSEYVKLAKQGGHQDLLTGENAEPEAIAKVKFSETDSEYVKMAKTGGHAGLLEMNGQTDNAPVKQFIKDYDSEYIRMAKTGGHADLLKSDGVPAVDPGRKNLIKDTDSEYVRLAKTGGHQGLLNSDAQPVDDSCGTKYKIKDSDSAYVKLAKTGGYANLLGCGSSKAELVTPRRNVVTEDDTAYVKLAKRGGDANLLKMEAAKPSTAQAVKYKSNSSDWFLHDSKRATEIQTTGKGRGTSRNESNNNSNVILPSKSQDQASKQGKRFFQPTNDRDPPFALHY